MVAEMIPPERDFRGPGCGPDCRTIRALLPGVFGRSELMLHDPDAHEAHGRAQGGPPRAGPMDIVVTGPLAVDLGRWTVTVAGEPVQLSPAELRLLRLLALNLGTVVERDELIRHCWGEAWVRDGHKRSLHALRVNLSRLRYRLGVAGQLLRHATGLGYLLDADGVALPIAGEPALRADGRWSIAWSACRDCGRTTLPHQGHGLCSTCRNRRARRGVSFDAEAPP